MSTLTSTTASSNFKTLTTIGFYSAFIGLGVTSAALGPTLPGLAQNTHSSLDAISSLFIGRSSGYLLGSLIGGSFYDRLPGSRLMAAMLTLMAVMLFFVPLASTLWLLVLIMGLLGVGEGALDTGGNTLLSRVHAGNLGPFMNGLHFFFGVGTSITPIIIAMTFLSSGSLNWAYWTLSLLLIPIIIWLFFQPNPPVQMQAHQVTGTTGISSRLLAWLVAALLFLYVGAEVGYGFTPTPSI
jgi:FHS family Na+ dependent glucose MFS transporter 1